jgi:uncharacterized damage-inducible protein DinB
MSNGGELKLLLEIIDQAYSRQAWHGPNLRGSIRGLRASEAAWRPGANRHTIYEIVVHAAYWKYAVRRRILGEKRGSFPLKGSNWFPCPARLTAAQWLDAVHLLEEQHRAMRKVISTLPPSVLHRKSPGSKHTHATLIYGIASHDVYHAGQIQLLKRLQSR